MAAGFEQRMQAGGSVLNVIACENMVGATDTLADAVFAELTDKPRVLEWVTENVGWANCAVDRIGMSFSSVAMKNGRLTSATVPPFETPVGASALDVGVEPFFEWTVDQNNLKGTVNVNGMHLVKSLDPYVERKLYTLNCGHASLAYLGFLRGYHLISETLGDEEIRHIVRGALRESGAALTKKHGFDPAEHSEYIDLIMQRFSNPALKDEVGRVGRQPIRKLGSRDRIIGPANILRLYGLPRKHVLMIAAAALHFYHEEDEESVQLQNRIRAVGVEIVFRDVSGWSPADPGEADDIQAVVMHYQLLAKWKVPEGAITPSRAGDEHRRHAQL